MREKLPCDQRGKPHEHGIEPPEAGERLRRQVAAPPLLPSSQPVAAAAPARPLPKPVNKAPA